MSLVLLLLKVLLSLIELLVCVIVSDKISLKKLFFYSKVILSEIHLLRLRLTIRSCMFI